jgi:hypothetical protein
LVEASLAFSSAAPVETALRKRVMPFCGDFRLLEAATAFRFAGRSVLTQAGGFR